MRATCDRLHGNGGVRLPGQAARIRMSRKRPRATATATPSAPALEEPSRAPPDVPSSVAIKALRRWAGQLRAHNGRLIISGVTPAAARILQRGGLDEILGEDGV